MIFICVPKMNESLTGLDWNDMRVSFLFFYFLYEGELLMTELSFFWVN